MAQKQPEWWRSVIRLLAHEFWVKISISWKSEMKPAIKIKGSSAQGLVGLDVVMGLRNFMMLLRDLLLMERSGERIDHKLKYPLRLMPIKLPISVEKMANHSSFSLFWNERVKLITHEKDNSRICSFANNGSHLLTTFWASSACSNLREFSLSRLLFRFTRHSICNKVLVRESSRVNETRDAKARSPCQASRGKVLAHSSSVFLSQF